MRRRNIVDFLEEQATGKLHVQTTTQVANESSAEDFPTQLDWDFLAEMEILEDSDRREREEVSFFVALVIKIYLTNHINLTDTSLLMNRLQRGRPEIWENGMLCTIMHEKLTKIRNLNKMNVMILN